MKKTFARCQTPFSLFLIIVASLFSVKIGVAYFLGLSAVLSPPLTSLSEFSLLTLLLFSLLYFFMFRPLFSEIRKYRQSEKDLWEVIEETKQSPAEIPELFDSFHARENPDFADNANSIFDICKSLIGATIGYIALLSADGKSDEILFLESGGLLSPEGNNLSMGLSGLRKQVYSNREIIYENNFSQSKWTEFMPKSHMQLDNVLFAPLSIDGEAVGIIALANKNGGFTAEDVSVAAAFARIVSFTLNNSRILEKLNDSEKRFRSVAQTASEAIITINSRGDIVFWNRAAEKIFGYPAQKILGKSLTLVIPGQFKEVRGNGGLQFVARDGPSIVGKTSELVGKRADGTDFPLELSLATWKTREGVFFTGIVRDITMRRLAENALQKTRGELEMRVKKRTIALAKANKKLRIKVIERKWVEKELQNSLTKLRKAMGGIIYAMGLALETRDPYTADHQRRVSNLARAIAAEMNFSKEDIDGIRMSGIIHDFGKISLPAEILTKPGWLTEFESGMIKTHPQAGYDILKTIEFPWPIAQIILQHHERMDGSGYPMGLSGDDILIESRILAVADVVEAIASHRPYRPALGIDKALEEISQKKNVLYDPDVVDACVKLFQEKKFLF